jgi:hypothetical protein
MLTLGMRTRMVYSVPASLVAVKVWLDDMV